MVWLLSRSKADRQYPLGVQTLLEIAYGTERIEQARQSSQPVNDSQHLGRRLTSPAWQRLASPLPPQKPISQNFSPGFGRVAITGQKVFWTAASSSDMDKSSRQLEQRSHSIGGGSKLEAGDTSWGPIQLDWRRWGSPQARKGLEPAKVVHAQRS